jgi:hypothetical protein
MFIDSGEAGSAESIQERAEAPGETPFQLFYEKDMKRRWLGAFGGVTT